jgi:sugar lactone lactonase YvrE
VAGNGTGKAYVYDAKTGNDAAVYQLTAPGSFVNDVVVTRAAAYFTDSARSFLYRVPLGPRGRLPEQRAVQEVPLGDDFEFMENEFNANGIDASPDGEYLIVVNSTTGKLYRVDPETGDATEIDLGDDTVTNGDGILLDGKTLYVVKNFDNEIAVVELDPGATKGEIVDPITDPDFDVPTTVAEFGNALYAVNARFTLSDEQRLVAEYDVVRVSK